MRTPTGIQGLDHITQGGLPLGRVTLVTGGAGTGKTILAVGALVGGLRRAKEPGVFVAFEESSGCVVADMSGFDWDLSKLSPKRLRFIDARLSESIVQDGDFDLNGLIAMLQAAVTQTGAKRIVLDGIDVLFSALGDLTVIHRELFRLRNWLIESKLTTIITAKTDLNGNLGPQYQFLEFMADGVVHLRHHLADGTAFRTLQVSKLRGTRHSANEFPFAVTRSGIEIAPGMFPAFDHPVSSKRVPTGVERLDTALGGGYYRGSSVLISGVPGTAKTTLAGAFAEAACRRKERTLLVTFDETPEQIVRNLASVNIQLGPHIESRTLEAVALRSRAAGPEAHVSYIWQLVHDHRPEHLIVDPLSALMSTGQAAMAQAAAVSLIDMAKSKGITVVATALLSETNPLVEASSIGVSTVADTWIHLSYLNQGGERNRALTIIKSRGMSHSNQVRELILDDTGVTLADVYLAGGEVLMGTLRWEKEREQQRLQRLSRLDLAQRRREAELDLEETERRVNALSREQSVHEARVARVKAELDAFEGDVLHDRQERRIRRHGDGSQPAPPVRRKSASRSKRRKK